MRRNYNKEIMLKTLNNIQTPHIVEKNWIVILFRKKIKKISVYKRRTWFFLFKNNRLPQT